MFLKISGLNPNSLDKRAINYTFYFLNFFKQDKLTKLITSLAVNSCLSFPIHGFEYNETFVTIIMKTQTITLCFKYVSEIVEIIWRQYCAEQ